MHRGPGAGSVSAAATDYGRQRGITVIDGGCPLMFGPTEEPTLNRVLAANSWWCREGPRINLGHGLTRTNASRAWPGVAMLIRRGGQRPWDLGRISGRA